MNEPIGKFTDVTTPQDFLIWWAANWKTASDSEIESKLATLTENDKETISKLARTMTN